MTNEYDRARAVFTVILGVALIFLQWLSAFWTINHLQIPISRIGRDYVKLLWISDSDVSSVSANLFPNIQEERKRGVAGADLTISWFCGKIDILHPKALWKSLVKGTLARFPPLLIHPNEKMNGMYISTELEPNSRLSSTGQLMTCEL